jgi:hypothetical protein
MTARIKAGFPLRNGTHGMPEVSVMEPDKCAGWDWVYWYELVWWARSQIKNQVEEGGSAVNGNNVRTLFSPMVDLLEQRPGVEPRL